MNAARGTFAIGVFAVMALWEVLAPRRSIPFPRKVRWAANLGVGFASALTAFVLLPGGVASIAAWGASRNLGLFRTDGLGGAPATLLGIAALDLAVMLQHMAFHNVGPLWRLHRIHHVEPALDVTSGIRFHPVEVALSLGWKGIVVLSLGISPVSAASFEVLLNACSLFNHGNVAMPARLDRFIRLCLVTPDMHRVHHSVRFEERNSNFGFCLPWWDRLLGTYRADPAEGQLGMELGILPGRLPEKPLEGFFELIAAPLRKRA
jgi:sterol desaturase/sphingolipid hydroxylase (fatty acid hydroxylase superfamily)